MAGALGRHHEKIEIRSFRTDQLFLNQHLSPATTSSFGILALEYPVQGANGIGRSETANSVEPDLAADSPAVTNLAVYQNAGRVVISEPRCHVCNGGIAAQPFLPDAAKSFQRYQHRLCSLQRAVLLLFRFELLRELVDARNQSALGFTGTGATVLCPGLCGATVLFPFENAQTG